MTLMEEAKRIRYALSLEGLSDQAAAAQSRYESFVSQKAAAKPEELAAKAPGVPGTTTLAEYLDSNIIDAKNVLTACKTNLEGLKTNMAAAPSVFAAADVSEITAKIVDTTAAIKNLTPTDAIGVA